MHSLKTEISLMFILFIILSFSFNIFSSSFNILQARFLKCFGQVNISHVIPLLHWPRLASDSVYKGSKICQTDQTLKVIFVIDLLHLMKTKSTTSTIPEL